MPKTKAKAKWKQAAVRRRRRRVFILGAGASASCGIAVARDILREAMQRLAKRDSNQADKVHDLLHYLYPGFSGDLSNYPNVEDFLNLVEMAKEFHGEAYIESKRWSQARLQEAADISLRAITEYIWGFMADEDRRRALSGFVRRLVRPSDVIISFNWDFMIDLALEDLDEDSSPVYSYSSSRDSVVLLKPHGSIDWFEKSNLPADKKLLKEMQHRATGVYFYPYFQLAQNPDLLKYPAFIVPPPAIKKFGGCLQRVMERCVSHRGGGERTIHHRIFPASGRSVCEARSCWQRRTVFPGIPPRLRGMVKGTKYAITQTFWRSHARFADAARLRNHFYRPLPTHGS